MNISVSTWLIAAAALAVSTAVSPAIASPQCSSDTRFALDMMELTQANAADGVKSLNEIAASLEDTAFDIRDEDVKRQVLIEAKGIRQEAAKLQDAFDELGRNRTKIKADCGM